MSKLWCVYRGAVPRIVFTGIFCQQQSISHMSSYLNVSWWVLVTFWIFVETDTVREGLIFQAMLQSVHSLTIENDLHI